MMMRGVTVEDEDEYEVVVVVASGRPGRWPRASRGCSGGRDRGRTRSRSRSRERWVLVYGCGGGDDGGLHRLKDRGRMVLAAAADAAAAARWDRKKSKTHRGRLGPRSWPRARGPAPSARRTGSPGPRGRRRASRTGRRGCRRRSRVRRRGACRCTGGEELVFGFFFPRSV